MGYAQDDKVLKTNEARLLLALQIGHAAMWSYDLKTRTFSGSSEAHRIFGLFPEGKEFTPEEIESCLADRGCVHDAIGELTGGEKEFKAEFDITPADGSPLKSVLAIARMERDRHGVATRLDGFIQDVTDRKRSEEALKHSETRYRELIEFAVDGMLLGSHNGVIIGANSYMQKLAGRSHENLIGSHISTLFDPDQMAVTPLRFDLLQKGETVINGRSIRRPDGTTVPVEMHTKMMPDGTYQSIYRDITERMKAEESLRESELKYRSVINASPVPMALIDEKHAVTFLNSAFVHLFGYTLEDVHTLEQWRHLAYPDVQYREHVVAGWKAELARAMAAGESLAPMEVNIRCKSGTDRTVMIGEAALSSSNDGSHLVVFYDITDRKHAEEVLQKREEYQRALLDNFPFAVWLKDIQSRFLAVNQKFAENFGFTSPEEIVGKNDYFIASHEAAEAYRAHDRMIMESRQHKSAEEQIVGQGMQKWFESYKAPVIGENDELFGTVGFMRDITDRKRAEHALRESEERFRKILQDVQSVAVQGYAPDGTIQYWNKASERLYGYSAEEAIGRNLCDLIIPHETRPSVEQSIRHMIETGQPIPSSELSLLRKDGSRVIVHSSHAIVQMTGRTPELFCIDIDLTERKTTDQILYDMQRRESIGILSGGMAHDFNNLFGSMMGNISLAQSYLPEDHPSVKNMEKAIAAMERATTLTQQMLAYSGKGRFQFTTMDIAAMIRDHIGLFTVSLPKNAKLVTHLPSEPAYVNGDPGQIEQIVMNLIINGGEAIADKQGTVSISLGTVSLNSAELARYSTLTKASLEPGAYAMIDVRDDGKGMSAEIQSKMFDPFFTTKFTGRGLGLSAVLGIIQGHKGGIKVESTVGSGTTFSVLLPLVPGPDPITPPLNESSPTHEDRGTTVLVIDDEAEIATTAKEMLEAGTYATLVELSPLKGIEVYRQHRSEIGVVLLDQTMPEMSGKEVADALRAINPDVKIIITSGYSEEEVTSKLGTTRVAAFIQKPYRLQSLLSLVNSVME